MNKYLVVDEYSDCKKIYNLYELKELLIDEIKRDSFENIDDKDIIRNNFCIMEYLALSKKDDIEYIKEQLKGFGYYVLDLCELQRDLTTFQDYMYNNSSVYKKADAVLLPHDDCIEETLKLLENEMK